MAGEGKTGIIVDLCHHPDLESDHKKEYIENRPHIVHLQKNRNMIYAAVFKTNIVPDLITGGKTEIQSNTNDPI